MTIPSETLLHLIETVHRLRAPGGCPWDRAQTHQSLRQYLIEEAYEVLDVLDQIHSVEDLKSEKTRFAFREELGDLLMQVLLHSEMANEAGVFNIYDVAKALDEKLVRRHPHVFGDTPVDSEESAFQRWEKEKAKEKAAKGDSSILEGVPRNLPALQKASRVIEKVTKVGFQWKDLAGPLSKLDEELIELKTEIQTCEKLGSQVSSEAEQLRAKDRVEAELGDVFFSLCNLAHHFKINPEDALRKTMARFEKRFRHIEQRLKEKGKSPEKSDLDEMDSYWDEAKELEKSEIWGLTGGIASGKSTAAKYFAEQGIPVIDADKISREIFEKNPEALAAIEKRFGTADRHKIKEQVFSNPDSRKDLEAILHPLIRRESMSQILTLSKTHPAIVYEASLLVETGRFKDFDELIVVEAPLSERLKRLQSRDAMSTELAHQMIQSQASDTERKRHATFYLENSGSEAELKTQVLHLLKRKGVKPRSE